MCDRRDALKRPLTTSTATSTPSSPSATTSTATARKSRLSFATMAASTTTSSATNASAAAAAAAAVLPQPLFPRPSSPVKPDLKPNPHPYAIKTTSTGVLSRSNSSPHNPQTARYHYVPTSPSPSGSPNHSPSHRQRLHGHKYSKSLSSDSPSPLPIPPSFTFPSLARGGALDHNHHRHHRHDDNEDNDDTPRRTKRAETLPSSAPSLDDTARITSDDLPSNPKSWTPAQLASYLATALRVKSGESLSLPRPVARDIAQFVRESGISGRGFLRLNSADLEEMGINSLWRTALLTASRNLRQNVLRGRIWGLGSSPDDDDDSKSTPASAPPGLANGRKIFHSRDYGGGYRNGRVRGMVEHLERSGSVSEGSADVYTRGRGGSVSSQGSEWSADEIESPTVSTGFEVPSEPEPKPETEPTMNDLLQTQPALDNGSWGARAWEEDLGIWETIKRVAAAEGGERVENGLDMHGQGYSVENQQRNGGEEGDASAESDAEFEAEIAKSRNKKGDVGIGSGSWSVGGDRGGHIEGRMRGKKERRIVTAIFVGENGQGDDSVPSGTADGEVSPSVEDAGQEEEIHLQAQMHETWALLQAFKRRLEEVEGKIEHMEERERLLAQERQAIAARQDVEIRRRREDERRVFERERARKREEEEVERRRMEDSRLSLALILRPHVLFSRILRLVSPTPESSLPSVSDVPPPTSSSSTTSTSVKDRGLSKLQRALYPTTISALPSYVFLVSLGVCAVVLRVFIRRVLGRRRAWDL